MSVVVPFSLRKSARGVQRSHVSQLAAHPARTGSLISWVRPVNCECCGRPTLAARTGLVTLCGHCSPPDIA